VRRRHTLGHVVAHGLEAVVEEGCLVSNSSDDSMWSMKRWRRCSGGGSGVFPPLSVPGNHTLS
jgi:hypothetical protein